MRWKTNQIDYYGLLVLTLGLVADLLWILFVKTQPFSDFQYYHGLAQQIANGGQWGDTYTSVGYPIVLGFFYKLFGANIVVAKSLNLVLSSVNNLLVFRILGRMGLPKRIRGTILTVFIFFPMNVYYNSILATEIMFTTIFLLIVYLYLGNARYKYWVIGLLTGINTMIKPFFPLFFLVVFLTEYIMHKKFLDSLKNSLVVLSVTIAVLSPWLYRNYRLIGEFTYVSNNGGIVLYINNNSQNKYGGWMPAEDIEDSVVRQPEYIKSNATERSKLLQQAAKKWIVSHPKDFLILGIKRIVRTYLGPRDVEYSLYGAQIPMPIKTLVIVLSEIAMRLFLLIGIFSMLVFTVQSLLRRLSFKRNMPAKANIHDIFLLISFFMFTLVYFITEGQSRYAFPTVFITIFYFSKAVQYIENWHKRLLFDER